MTLCQAITKGGVRCKRQAIEGYQHCYSHRPDLAEQRKRNAQKGGRAGGRGRGSLVETDQAKRHVKSLVGRLIREDVDRDTATAAFMGIHCLMRILEQERKLIEQHELTERIEALEHRARVEQRTSWHSRGRQRS